MEDTESRRRRMREEEEERLGCTIWSLKLGESILLTLGFKAL